MSTWRVVLEGLLVSSAGLVAGFALGWVYGAAHEVRKQRVEVKRVFRNKLWGKCAKPRRGRVIKIRDTFGMN